MSAPTDPARLYDGRIYADTGPSRIGWSYYGTAARCLTLFSLTYRVGIDPGYDPDATLRGSMGHVGQAQNWNRVRARQQKSDPERYLTPLEGMERYAREHDGMVHLPEMTQCYLAYTSTHAEAPGTILMVEEELVLVAGWLRNQWGLWLIHPEVVDQIDVRFGEYEHIPHMDGGYIRPARMPYTSSVVQPDGSTRTRSPHVFVSRRIDMAYRARGGVFIVDWKHTSHDVGKGRAAKYAADGQWALNRIAGGQRWPGEFSDVVCALIKTVAPFPSKWHRMPATPWRDQTMPQRIWDIASRIAQLDAEGRSPWEWPRADHENVCHSRYGTCPMLEHCDWGPPPGSPWRG